MIKKIILKYLLCFALIYSCQDNSKPNYQYMPNMYEAIGYDTYSESDAFSNGIEAFCCGGYPGTVVDYEIVKIASLGNALSGDNIKHGGYWPGAGCSNSTRGIWAGGANNPSNYSR